MKKSTKKHEFITFSPNLYPDDAYVRYWLRQVTLRLRREICWVWHERGISSDSSPAALPPFVNKASATLDMVRYWEEKSRFFQTDSTAQYLTEQLKADPPIIKERKQGSFGWIVNRLALDDTATFVLALGLAVSYDNAMGNVIACCLNDQARILPNLALAQKLWDHPEQVLTLADPAHPLFSYGLLQSVSQPSHQHSVIDWENPIAVPALVANQLLFSNLQLPKGIIPVNETKGKDIIQSDNISLLVSQLKSDSRCALRIVPVRGPEGSIRTQIIRGILKESNRDVVEFNGDYNLFENNHYVNSIAVFCWLRDMDLFLSEDLVSSLSREKQRSGARWLPLESIPVTIFLGITDRSQLTHIPDHLLLPIIDVPRFTYHERVKHWKEALGEKAKGLDSTISECSRRFRYEKETINRISKGLIGLSRPILEKDLFIACRAELELDIGELAQRVIPRFEDEELILPHKQDMQFQEIVKAMGALTEVHYGWGTAKVWNESGISVLFAGPPGTGKTMAAEIMAIKLDLPMYRIDLSQVVNKYIGETEKNLKKLFDASDISDMILFFDEADSLFGRRTEVKDAHDRYANLEISYLLERMERFKGLAILATNRKKDLDEAFLRRLRYIIDFPIPGEEERKKIWRQVIPTKVLFNIDLKCQTLLNKEKFSKDLRQEFDKYKIALSKDDTISVKKKDSEWMILDKDNKRTFSVWKNKHELYFYDDSKLDIGFLAKQFPLAGGHIRSIVFNACLQSANGSSACPDTFKGQLTMEQIIIAVKREYDKLNRSASLEHFGPHAKIVEKMENKYEKH
jgi:DNA polymerase III delta prime subunit